MQYTGNLKKMISSLDGVVHYSLDLGNQTISINELLGKKIALNYLGEIHCIKCGRLTKKSFAQGFCYPCFQSAPEAEECVLRPELCRAQEGIARDMEFAKEHCLIDHYVYLSLTSNIKVGVTRHHQIPTRWIDQGATEALKLAKTPNRFLAGLIEVELKNYLADKTNWRNMLTGKSNQEYSLSETKKKIIPFIPDQFKEYLLDQDEITCIEYPMIEKPEKVVSANLEKIPVIGGVLTGIKGQYIIIDNRNVLNIRKYSGYKVSLEA